ncbi:hypothetical protein HYV86_03260 [Candidatus Woesearchaeota archaeon]|nr:hypothetical protein [Candidatus Woesearchaeota archaeon]
MKPRLCPKCGSPQVEVYDVGFLRCRQCGYDELEPEPLGYDPRKNQKAKTEFTPYKTGGAKRTIKK